MFRPALLLVCSTVLFPASGALAHHSLAPYAMAEVKSVEGTVKNFDWSNPHVKIGLLVPDGRGGASEWEFEGGSVGRLTNGGFTKDVVATGDKITVMYNPRRDHTIGGFFVAVKTADGTMYSTDRFRNQSAR